MEYRLFKNPYVDRKTGGRRMGEAWNVAFRDHLNRRQSVAGSVRERDAHTLAGQIGELVRCRSTGEPLPAKLMKWLDSMPVGLRKRLTEMDLIDARMLDAGKTLAQHLDGRFDAEGKLIDPGFKQALQARGNTENHVKVTTDRVRRIIDGCGFVFWKDIAAPGASTSVEVFLGNLRTKQEISGATLNYYMRDTRSFCRWLAKTGKAPSMALASLESVKNAETDSEARRPLSIDEMKLLLSAAVNGEVIQGMTGDERALLYRVAFETGMRPGQIRSLLVKDFALDGDNPTVTTQAKYVKRRRIHTQALRPALAADLKARFASKMPTATAIKMPSKYHLADMLRSDLASARATWIGEVKTDKEREERQRSDFLADKSHAGAVAVFYGLRHGHGTALADAGVPEKDIAASMHHASRKTTERYIHADRQSMARAMGSMPDLSLPTRNIATGTNGPEATTEASCPCSAHATGTSCVDSGGQTDSHDVISQNAVSAVETTVNAVSTGETANRPLGGIGRRDGLKIHCRKTYRFESDRGHLSIGDRKNDARRIISAVGRAFTA
jgi:integrase